MLEPTNPGHITRILSSPIADSGGLWQYSLEEMEKTMDGS